MKILHLTLYRKYFDEIVVGRKKVEHRNLNDYWIKRLFIDFPIHIKWFDQIHFRNGYGKGRPLVKVEHCWTSINDITGKIDIILGNIIK